MPHGHFPLIFLIYLYNFMVKRLVGHNMTYFIQICVITRHVIKGHCTIINAKIVQFLESIHLLYMWIAPENTKNCMVTRLILYLILLFLCVSCECSGQSDYLCRIV